VEAPSPELPPSDRLSAGDRTEGDRAGAATSVWATIGRWTLYIGRRLLTAVIAILGVVLVVFVVTRLIGDPVYLILGQRASEENVAELRAQLGYDRSIVVQFVDYLGNLSQGDFGVSQFTQRPVADEIWNRFPATLELSVAAMFLGLLWTIPLGVISALRPRGIVDRISQSIVEFGVAIPSFLLGLLLIYVFYYHLGVAPTPVGELGIGTEPPPDRTGFVVIDAVLAGQWGTLGEALSRLVLPAVTLAITACPPILQLTRNSMISVLQSDFIRSARSLGLPQRTITWQYALRNALLPVLSMTAMTFGFLLGGTVLVENVFAWPGIGLYAVDSMERSDYEPVVGVTILAAAVYVLAYLIADLVSMAVDPRVRGKG